MYVIKFLDLLEKNDQGLSLLKKLVLIFFISNIVGFLFVVVDIWVALFIYFSGSLTFAIGLHFISSKLDELKNGKNIAILFVVTLLFEFVCIIPFILFLSFISSYSDTISAISFVSQNYLLFYLLSGLMILYSISIISTTYLLNGWFFKIFERIDKKFNYYFDYGIFSFLGLVISSISIFGIVTLTLEIVKKPVTNPGDFTLYHTLFPILGIGIILLFIGLFLKLLSLFRYYRLLNDGMNLIHDKRRFAIPKPTIQSEILQ